LIVKRLRPSSNRSMTGIDYFKLILEIRLVRMSACGTFRPIVRCARMSAVGVKADSGKLAIRMI
jgi:hypothetical protein